MYKVHTSLNKDGHKTTAKEWIPFAVVFIVLAVIYGTSDKSAEDIWRNKYDVPGSIIYETAGAKLWEESYENGVTSFNNSSADNQLMLSISIQFSMATLAIKGNCNSPNTIEEIKICATRAGFKDAKEQFEYSKQKADSEIINRPLINNQ